MIICLTLPLAGCNGQQERHDRETVPSATADPQPAPPEASIALGLKEVLDLAIPASGVTRTELESIDVDVAGRLAAVLYPPDLVTVWDVVERRRADEIQVPTGTGTIALSPDGTLLLTFGGVEAGASIWDISSKQRLASATGDHFFGYGFSRSSDKVAFAGAGGIVVLGARNGQRTLLTHDELAPLLPVGDLGTDPVNGVYFGPDDETIIASSFSYWLSWRPGEVPDVVKPDYGIRGSQISPDRQQLLLVGSLGLARWDITSRQQVGITELPGDINSMDGWDFDASGDHLIVTRSERSPVDPIYTHTRVTEYIEAYKLPEMERVWSATVEYFRGPYTDAYSDAGPSSGDLVLLVVANEQLVLRNEAGQFALLSGPEFAECIDGLVCREGFAYGEANGVSVLYKWMYQRWRPVVEGTAAGGTLTEGDLEAEGFYGPYFAEMFPEAGILLQ